MILGLDIAFAARDRELVEILAQPLQRPFVEKAGEIVGAVGQELAAAEPDEQIEVLALDLVGIGQQRGFRQRRVSDAERARIGAQPGQPLEQPGIRRGGFDPALRPGLGAGSRGRRA